MISALIAHRHIDPVGGAGIVSAHMTQRFSQCAGLDDAALTLHKTKAEEVVRVRREVRYA